MSEKPWGEGAGELRSFDLVQRLRARVLIAQERERRDREWKQRKAALIARIKALARRAREAT